MEAELIRFFQARFPRLEDGWTIEIRAFHSRGGGKHRRKFCDSPEEAAAFVVTLPPDIEVYYGLNPRLGDDGTKAGVVAETCIYGDVDLKHFQSRQEAEDACLGLDLPPTFLIFSGHGFQPVWQLTAPLGREHLARVEHANRRLAFALGGMDSVQDASRIFRVPFTTNNKDVPVPVTIELFTGRTYTLEQLEAMLPALPPVNHNPKEFRANLDSDGKVDPNFVRMLLTYIDKTQPYAINTSIWAAVAFYFPGPDGEQMVDEWCSDARIANGQHSCPRNQPTKHASFRRMRGNVSAMGTLIFYAKQGGYKPPGAPVPLTPTTGARKRQTEETLAASMEGIPSPSYHDLPHFVRGMYDFLGPLTNLIDRDFTTQMCFCALSQFFPGWRVENLNLCLWGLGVAASGGGKNLITDAIRQLLLGVPRHAPFYTTGSPEGILRVLDGVGKILCIYQDEWADFYAVMRKDYMAGMSGVMCSLHDGRPVAHRLSKQSVVIEDPYVTMMATTTPVKIVEHLKGADIDGGLVGRLWVTLPRTFEGHVEYTINEAIKARLADEIGQHVLDLEGLVTKKRCRFYQERPDELAALEAELGIGTGIWRTFADEIAEPRRARGRHVARWKVIAAACELWKQRPEVENGVLVITRESCALALALVRRAIIDQAHLLLYIGGSEDTKNLDKIRRALARTDQDGLTRSELLRTTHIKASELTRLLNILEDAKEVQEGIGAGGTIVYRKVGGTKQQPKAPEQDAPEVEEDNL